MKNGLMLSTVFHASTVSGEKDLNVVSACKSRMWGQIIVVLKFV